VSRPARRVLLAFVALAAVQHPPVLSAQPAVLRGTVVDDTRAPIAGVTVSAACREGTSTAITDAGGAFELRISDLIGECHVVIARLGFRSVAFDAPLGRLIVDSPIVMQHGPDTALALRTGVGSPLLANRASPFSSRWQVSSRYSTGASAAGLERTFERLAGGARWQAQWQATHVTRSGFAIAGTALGRRGYGMPLFMSTPFGGGQALPDFSPARSTDAEWNTTVTVTTPSVHFGRATLAAAVEAFTQVGTGGTASTPKPDRGARGLLHIRFR